MSDSKQEEKYLEEGINAIKQYETENLRAGLDQTIHALEGDLNFKGTAKTFRSKVLEFTGIGLGGKKATRKFLNKNKYTNRALDFIDRYVKENPEDIKAIINEVEKEAGIELADIGIDKNFYDNLLVTLKKSGIFGKEGGLKLTSDTLIDNIEGAIDSFSKVFGDEYVKGTSINDIGQFLNSELKVTPEGIKESYKENGYSGILNYTLDNVVINGAAHLEDLLYQLEVRGIDHGLTPAKIIDIYREGGLLGKNGIADTAAGLALGNIPGSEKYVYFGILKVALKNKSKKLKRQIKSSAPFGAASDEIDNYVNNAINEGIKKLMRLSEQPAALSKGSLMEVYEEHGLLGENGLFSYLNQNSESIFEDARLVGMIEEEDIKSFNDFAQRMSKAQTLKEILNNYNNRTDYETFAINLSKKADALGIKPVDLLRNPEYINDREAVIERSYGSASKLYSKRYGQLSSIVPIMDKVLAEVQKADIDTDELVEEVKALRPDNKFLGKAFDAVVSRYLKRTIVQRTTDYLKLTKGLIEQQVDFGKKEVQKYETNVKLDKAYYLS